MRLPKAQTKLPIPLERNLARLQCSIVAGALHLMDAVGGQPIYCPSTTAPRFWMTDGAHLLRI